MTLKFFQPFESMYLLLKMGDFPASHVIVFGGLYLSWLVEFLPSRALWLELEGLAPPIERFGSDVFPTVDGRNPKQPPGMYKTL